MKWGIRKRFETGNEVKVPLYGFYHSKDELFLIKEDEAAIVREIFERFVHGDAPMDILSDCPPVLLSDIGRCYSLVRKQSRWVFVVYRQAAVHRLFRLAT